MKELLYSLNGGFPRIKAGLCAVLLAIYAALVVISGGRLTELLLFAACAFFLVYLPGCFLGQVMYGKDPSAPVSVRLGLGLALTALLHIAAMLTGIGLIRIFVPAMLGLCYIYSNRVEIADLRNGILMAPPARTVILIYACVVFMFALVVSVKHAHPKVVGEILLSQDFMWTVGNAESLKVSFPPMDIRYRGVTLTYHYMTELLAASLSCMTGISCYDILAFYLQTLIAAFMISRLYDLGIDRFPNSELRPVLFTASFFVLSCLSLWKALPNGYSLFGNSLLQTLISNVNSQATAFGFLAVFCLMSRESFSAKGFQSVKYYTITYLFFICFSFSKSPMAAIVTIAYLLAAIVSLIGRNRDFKVIGPAVLFFMTFAVIYLGFLSGGASASVGFSLTGTLKVTYFRNYLALAETRGSTVYLTSIPLFMIIQTVCIAPIQTVTVVPRMLRDTGKLFTLSFDDLFRYACIVGGILAFFLTSHEAFSQVYFIYVAIFFMNLVTCREFTFRKLNTVPGAVSRGALGLSMLTAMFMLINFGGSGIRQVLFNTDMLEKFPYPFVVKSEDELAGEFLREHMSEDDLFITNRIHTGAGEGLSNVYTCFSGKRSYMEGFKYTASNMGVEWKDIKPRYDMVTHTFDGIYSPNTIVRACQKRGIRYIVYSSQFEGDCENLINCSLVFDRGSVRIYEVPTEEK